MDRELSVLKSFASDAIRLISQALEHVKKISRQDLPIELRVKYVSRFYSALHTLKGTACMVKGAESLAESIHKLEGMLACQSVQASAENLTWLPQANESLATASDRLRKI